MDEFHGVVADKEAPSSLLQAAFDHHCVVCFCADCLNPLIHFLTSV